MDIYSKKVKNLPFTCSLEISLKGEIKPETIYGIQPFFDSEWIKGDFHSFYFSKSSFSYGEKSSYSAPGYSYEQILKLRFPSNDGQRVNRIIGLEEIKFVKLILSDGRSAIFGRNDYKQNAKPKLEIESTLQLTEITFTNFSITPLGFIYGY